MSRTQAPCARGVHGTSTIYIYIYIGIEREGEAIELPGHVSQENAPFQSI
jgi:hypothetical protein